LKKIKPKPDTQKQIQKILKDTPNFFVIYSESNGDYNCALKAKDGHEVQNILETTIFYVAETIDTDAITLCKSMLKHLESLLTPQSSGQIN